MRQHKVHPPHLISVATLPCESQNTENVTSQQDITKENCIRCIIASSRWTRVIMCLKFTYMGVIQQSVHETKIHDIHDLRNAWCKLGLTLTRASSMLAWPSDIRCACWWWTLWTHALTWMFIYMIHQNILWNCRCNLMHVTAILCNLKLKLCSHAFSVFLTFTR